VPKNDGLIRDRISQRAFARSYALFDLFLPRIASRLLAALKLSLGDLGKHCWSLPIDGGALGDLRELVVCLRRGRGGPAQLHRFVGGAQAVC
jgi:hypothetical protein